MNNTLYRFAEKRREMGKPIERIGGNHRKAELRYNSFIHQANSLSPSLPSTCEDLLTERQTESFCLLPLVLEDVDERLLFCRGQTRLPVDVMLELKLNVHQGLILLAQVAS